MKKTCFVISPIGKEGTDIRQHADDLYDLVIQPALESFGFDVVRADKINKPSIITNDIIELVQQSELCIVDLTSSNPNVFYECGRRHEVGKPCLQLIKKGETIPFDLGGIRTIEYDMVTPRSVKEAIDIIRSYVNEFERDEYRLKSSGTSLATLAAAVSRIEQKLSLMWTGKTTSLHNDVGGGSNWDRMKTILEGPRAIDSMIASGDLDGAADLLIKSRSRFSAEKYRQFAILLAMAGSLRGRDLIMEMITAEIMPPDSSTTFENLMLLIGSITQFYSLRDEEKVGLEELSNMFAVLFERYTNNNIYLAFLHGQLAKLYSGSGDLETAFINLKKAHEYAPSEEAYKKQYEQLAKHLGKDV